MALRKTKKKARDSRPGVAPAQVDLGRIRESIDEVDALVPRRGMDRSPVNLAGISPGVKFQRVNRSNNSTARRAERSLPVARAWAAQAMAAKDSLYA